MPVAGDYSLNMTNTESTKWAAINANVKVGSTVKIHLSDGPEFTGNVKEIQEDENFGASFLVTRVNREPIWVSEHRLVAVAVK